MTRRAGGALLALAIAACGDVVAQPIGDAPPDGSAPPGDDAGTSADTIVFADASAFCAGHGPVPLPGGSACTGDLAHVFRFAACACSSFDVSGTLVTDAFDSSADGGGGASAEAASVASNGELSINAQATVAGSLYAGGIGVMGAPTVTLKGKGTLAHDLWSGGDVRVGGFYQVERDLWADGNVSIDSGALTVVGAVHLPAGDSAPGVTAGGGVMNGPVQLAPPCDCTNLLDVPAIVAAHAGDNDDGALGLATTALDHPAAPVQLPCGRYYVDGVQGGAVTLAVQGRVALFVAGDLSVDRSLTVMLAPGAELDLFVAGNVSVQGSATLGDVAAPARVRLYVGGSSVQVSAMASVGANVYAPKAVVAAASDFEMWGAIYAQAFQFSGNFKIHYDTSVLGTTGCAPTGGPCNTCDDCGGSTPACKGGTCVACAVDADCCAPLECMGGRCVLPAQ